MNPSIPIYYINLDRSTKRNDIMIESLNNLGTKYHRVSAIDMNNITRDKYSKGTVNNIQYIVKQNNIYNPKGKEIAIILSHFKALHEIINNDDDIAIILEDDTSFQYISDWNIQINNIISRTPADWNIIKLHSSSKVRIEKNISLCKKGILYDKMGNTDLQSAGCYIIKKDAARQIIIKYHIDNVYKFPYENEHAVCECIIFSIPNVYMYTLPLICCIENNVTCGGNYNIADVQSNKLIHDYWKYILYNNKSNNDKTQNYLGKETAKKIKIMSIMERKTMR
jgi:GR25 family glycosyltransferase involved in LPS biosynthesis